MVTVSCPGVHLPAKDDVYLSVCFMGQYYQSEDVPAVFPLLFHEKMTFEKIFRHAVDPGDITVMLECETVKMELVQLIPPMGDALACFDTDARRFLFPEPKLVPAFSRVYREVLMSRASHFPGIAPRLEFSTKTTIVECLADDVINIYPTVTMRPVMKANMKCSGRPRRKLLPALGREQRGRIDNERKSNTRLLSHTPRSRSLSPLRMGNFCHLAQLSLDSAAPGLADASQSMLASWPRASPPALTRHSALFTSSPLTKSSSSVRFSSFDRRKSFLNGSRGGVSVNDPISSETNEPLNCRHSPDSSALWQVYRTQATHNRSVSSSHREWEEVHERVQGLLTTPKAVRRLVYGATVSEVNRILAKRSISPGPP